MSEDREIKRIAIQLLSRREHSVKELRCKLLNKSFASALIDAVLERLREEGWQSDARFAEAYVRMRTGNGFGPTRILQELSERGVDESLGMSLLNQDEAAWFSHASSAREKKFGEIIPDEFQLIAKQKRFLQYRGFTNSQINHALGD